MDTTTTPSAKAQAVVDIIKRSGAGWSEPVVTTSEAYGMTFEKIEAERPGNVYTAVRMYVQVARGTKLLGGSWDSFGSHFPIKTWRDVRVMANV